MTQLFEWFVFPAPPFWWSAEVFIIFSGWLGKARGGECVRDCLGGSLFFSGVSQQGCGLHIESIWLLLVEKKLLYRLGSWREAGWCRVTREWAFRHKVSTFPSRINVTHLEVLIFNPHLWFSSQPQRILLQTSQRDLIGWFTWGCSLISCLFGLFYHCNVWLWVLCQ